MHMASYSFRQLILLIMIVSIVSGCSVFSPVKMPTPDKYVLKEVPYVPAHRMRPITIAIAPVTSEPLYDRIDMAYAVSPYAIDYFTQSEWAESPTKMVQLLLAKSLQSAHYFRGVVSLPSYARYDYLVNAQLLDLKQLFFAEHSYYQVKIKVDLIDARSGRLIASKTFSATSTARENNAKGGVVAANHAMADVLRQIAQFCTKKIS